MKIDSLQQLASVVGAAHPTIESISHRIYKGTDCGAWVDIRQVAQHKTTRFKVIFGDSIFGPVAHSWQVNGRGPWRRFDEVAPRELLRYLSADDEEKLVGPGKTMLRLAQDAGQSLADVRARTADFDNIEWFPRKQDTAWVTLDVVTLRPGVGVGSTVEGIDATTETHELTFPFTDKQFWAAVQAVEDEASALWNDTHGCDDCGDEDEFGNRPVNPQCKTCSGNGTVI